MKEDSSGFVQSFARGLTVIRAFDADHPRLTLSDVARRTQLARAVARRLLLTLEHLGYVRHDGSLFSLTPRVLELGFSYLSALSFPEVVQPHLERLSHETGESSSAAVLDGEDIVYVARVPTRRIMNARIMIGTRFPAHATSMGRVLLAHLPPGVAHLDAVREHLAGLTERTITDPREFERELQRVREQGWALVDGELESGLRSVAAPVHAADGSVVAAINVSSSATRDSMDRIQEVYLPALLSAAQQVDHDLRLI